VYPFLKVLSHFPTRHGHGSDTGHGQQCAKFGQGRSSSRPELRFCNSNQTIDSKVHFLRFDLEEVNNMKFLHSIPFLIVGALGVLVAFASSRSPVLAARDHQHDLELVQQAQQGKFDPLPAIALSPAIPEKGYRLEKLGDGVYMVTEGTYQMMFLTTGKGVIAVDAPPTIGGNILKAIREVTEEPITHVIYSHAHADHIGGASLYPKTAIIIGQESTARQLRVARDKNRPIPTITFKNKYTLTVGNQTLQLE
jgi:hypothetical protein